MSKLLSMKRQSGQRQPNLFFKLVITLGMFLVAVGWVEGVGAVGRYNSSTYNGRPSNDTLIPDSGTISACNICHMGARNSCKGCHTHSVRADINTNYGINLAANLINGKTAYKVGETINVELDGGNTNDSGDWVRASLYDDIDAAPLDVASNCNSPGGETNGCGGSAALRFPITLKTTAKLGMTKLTAAWFGYLLDLSGAELASTDGNSKTSWRSRTYLNAANHGEVLVTTADITVTPADLTVTVTDDKDPVTIGENFTYTITVTNASSSDATNVVLKNTLPSEVSYVSSMASPGSCDHVTGTVTCALGDLNIGNTATVTITVTADSAGTITTKAIASSSVGDSGNITQDTTVTANTKVVKFSGGLGSTGWGLLAILFSGLLISSRLRRMRGR